MKAYHKQLASPKTKPWALGLAVWLIVLFFNLGVSPGHAASVTHLSSPFYRVRDDEGAVRIGALRVGDADAPATVDYATGDCSAYAGEDYVLTSGSLEFAPGEALKYI